MMWNYLKNVVVVVFITSTLRYGEGETLERYTCKGGRYLAIVNTPMTLTESGRYCVLWNGNQLNVHDVNVRQYLCGATLFAGEKYWVAKCTTVQTINGQLQLKNVTDCNSEQAFPICVSNAPFISANTLTTPIASSPKPLLGRFYSTNDQMWKIIGQSEYFVINKDNNYQTAYEYCNETYNASLVTFLNLMSYFEVFVQLRLSINSFWVGANTNKTLQNSHCIAYHGDNQTISPKPCDDMAFSVCRRSIYHNNTDEALLHPQFIQLLKEMTVEKSETTVNKRKMVSVEDKRPSAKTAGGLGVFILCFIVLTMVMLDLTRLKK